MAYLLERGVDPNAPDDLDRDPLGQAVVSGNVEVVRLLLDSGATVDRPGDGWTPLMDATLSSDLPMVRLLLEYGADPTLRASDGRTVLELARSAREMEMESLISEALSETAR